MSEFNRFAEERISLVSLQSAFILQARLESHEIYIFRDFLMISVKGVNNLKSALHEHLYKDLLTISVLIILKAPP